MNAEETGRLVAMIASVCPQQPLIAPDEEIGEPGTAAYWWPLLEDVRYVDARDAVMRLARRKPFIGVSEVIETVKVIRSERLDAIPEAQRPVPNVGPNDVPRYLAGKRAIEKKIADGEIRSDGSGGYVLPSAQWQHAIAAGPTVDKGEIDLSKVFAEVPRPSASEQAAERAAREAEARERQRQIDALAAVIADYEKARQGKLARKRKMGRTVKALADSGGTMREPQAVRDTAAS